jgi:glycosyltransferase involved in cell wall biosynthesis
VVTRVRAQRLLVVSHPAVLATNQLPYAEMRSHGWDPFIVTPAQWRHDYASDVFAHEILDDLGGRVVGRRVAFKGSVQRHAYLTGVGRLIAEVEPDAAFIEAEPTSMPALQWGWALDRAGVPFGLQADENLDRAYPLPARMIRRWCLRHAAYIASRSPAAAALVRGFHSDVPTPLIPHHVPQWDASPRDTHDSIVIGYAGRFVPEKGLDVLIDAVAGVDGVRLRFVGNGPLREDLRTRAAGQGIELEIDTTVTPGRMPAAYASFDVLVLPSLSTPTWEEQFGRVLVEAMWCGVPVIGSDSGEIPWVIESTGGGMVVPEGDVGALRAMLVRVRDDPALRRELADRGREQAMARFSVASVARELDVALRATMRA